MGIPLGTSLPGAVRLNGHRSFESYRLVVDWDWKHQSYSIGMCLDSMVYLPTKLDSFGRFYVGKYTSTIEFLGLDSFQPDDMKLTSLSISECL